MHHKALYERFRITVPKTRSNQYTYLGSIVETLFVHIEWSNGSTARYIIQSGYICFVTYKDNTFDKDQTTGFAQYRNWLNTRFSIVVIPAGSTWFPQLLDAENHHSDGAQEATIFKFHVDRVFEGQYGK